MEILIYLAIIIATARITRFITIDKLAEPARLKLIKKYGADHKLTYLAHCPWCMSIWISLILTPAYWAFFIHPHHSLTAGQNLFLIAALTLTTAHAAAMIITEFESSH